MYANLSIIFTFCFAELTILTNEQPYVIFVTQVKFYFIQIKINWIIMRYTPVIEIWSGLLILRMKYLPIWVHLSCGSTFHLNTHSFFKYDPEIIWIIMRVDLRYDTLGELVGRVFGFMCWDAFHSLQLIRSFSLPGLVETASYEVILAPAREWADVISRQR